MSSVIIPGDIGKLLDERVKVWANFDSSQSTFENLNRLLSKIKSSEPAKIAESLSGGNLPTLELASALSQLESELAKIEKSESTIRSHKEEIEKIESQQRWMIAIAIIVVIVIIIISSVWIVGQIFTTWVNEVWF